LLCCTQAEDQGMDLLFGTPREVEKEETAVLELLNCSVFFFSQDSRRWVRQAPGDLCRLLVFHHTKRYRFCFCYESMLLPRVFSPRHTNASGISPKQRPPYQVLRSIARRIMALRKGLMLVYQNVFGGRAPTIAVSSCVNDECLIVVVFVEEGFLGLLFVVCVF
jgi:hypothetical protein